MQSFAVSYLKKFSVAFKTASQVVIGQLLRKIISTGGLVHFEYGSWLSFECWFGLSHIQYSVPRDGLRVPNF